MTDRNAQIDRLLIIADDLTGAADTAARCHQAGMDATVFVQPPGLPLPTGAVTVSTDSRHLEPAAARAAVATHIRALAGLTATLWYKKIDSTLRGNLGIELDAMLETLASVSKSEDEPRCALICPAFPAQARGLLDGFLEHRDLEPRTLFLPALLSTQSRRPTALIRLAAVRSGQLAVALQDARRSGAQLLVVDAVTDDDLAAIVDGATDALPDALFCGSAGLVGILASRLVATASAPATDISSVVKPTAQDRGERNGPIMVIVGSGSPMARAQIDTLRALPTVNSLEIHEDGTSTLTEGDGAGERPHWLLHLPMPQAGTPLDGPAARRLADQLADQAMLLIDERQPHAIILVGGDTAIHLLTRLEAVRLDVLAELLPGMPLTRLHGEREYSPLVILKAGNHGDKETLATLMDAVSTGRW